jgi:hypothetical protein
MNALTKTQSLASPQELAGEVVKMFSGYANFYQPPEQFRVTVAAYVEKISAYPLRIVSVARQRITDRALPKPPSAGEFRTECERVQYPCGRPPAKAAKPSERGPDSEMAGRVGSMMADLAKDLAANAENSDLRRRGDRKTPEEVRREAAAKLDQLYAKRFESIALSPQTRKAMGLKLTPEEEEFLQGALR